jgi:hypothetical protein
LMEVQPAFGVGTHISFKSREIRPLVSMRAGKVSFTPRG